VNDQKKYLTAGEILSAQDIETVDVEVPEWGGTVRLKSLSGEEASRFGEMFEKDKTGASLKILALSAVNEEGERLFSDTEVAQLKRKSLRAILKLQKEALRINGLTDDEEKKTKND